MKKKYPLPGETWIDGCPCNRRVISIARNVVYYREYGILENDEVRDFINTFNVVQSSITRNRTSRRRN